MAASRGGRWAEIERPSNRHGPSFDIMRGFCRRFADDADCDDPMNFTLPRLFACTLAVTAAASMHGQTSSPTPADSAAPWWKHAVIYEIFPRSFQDSNGDGVGDLNGITSRLDYLKALGVDAIWITPCFPSPLLDTGYDVSDYENIDPELGTLTDFDRLVAEARARHIHVLLDFVANHTSDQHAWFKDAVQSRTAAHRDWYVWRDGKTPGAPPQGTPPNNWVSQFGGSAWTYSPATGQWYFHEFMPQQPDLNWRNPAVRKAMYDAMRFWLARGASGFRLDAVPSLFEDPTFADTPSKFDRLAEAHGVLREMHAVAAEYPGSVLMGETYTKNAKELALWYGHDDELDLALNFPFDLVNEASAPKYGERLADNEQALSTHQPTLFLSSHDEGRSFDRFGDGTHNDAISRVMTTLLLTARGTPVLYYGEEIGMSNAKTVRRSPSPDDRFPMPKADGREPERSPMQWTTGRNAGFTTGTPWLSVGSSSPAYNVQTESAQPLSHLEYTRSVLKLRRQLPALNSGSYVALAEDQSTVLAYERRLDGAQTVLVLLNMSPVPEKPQMQLKPLNLSDLSVQLSSEPESTFRTSGVLLPYEAVIAVVKH
jgi:alpha-glucosidase